MVPASVVVAPIARSPIQSTSRSSLVTEFCNESAVATRSRKPSADASAVAAFDGFDVRGPGDERDVGPDLREAATDDAPEPTCTENDDVHGTAQSTLVDSRFSMNVPRWPHISPRPV